MLHEVDTSSLGSQLQVAQDPVTHDDNQEPQAREPSPECGDANVGEATPDFAFLLLQHC